MGPSSKDVSIMLEKIGVSSVEQLISETIPKNIRLTKTLDLDTPLSEHEYLKHIQELSEHNQVCKTYIGLGYHETVTPPVIQRNIFENPGWYTAYTPYQAEIAQGRLEALLNYQTMICDLTGMSIANASLLDESTAAAEAMSLLFAVRSRTQKKNAIAKFFVDQNTLPQTLSLLETRSNPIGIELVVGDPKEFTIDASFFGALLQYPGKYGEIHDYSGFIENAASLEIKTVVAADLMSLVLLTPPGELGADVVVGTSQRFGIPLGYGGPHAAFFATKEEYKRNVPGRIIGVTKDLDNKRALRMALQTREQHIKRDRATSNICTSQVLLAVMAGMYGVYHGPEGLQFIAKRINELASILANSLEEIGLHQRNAQFFDTIVIDIPSEVIQPIALKKSINLLYIDNNSVGISINEATTIDDIQELVDVFAEAISKESIRVSDKNISSTMAASLQRKSEFLTNDVFSIYRSETSLMRYIKQLERKDLSLNHSMIPLGSCTMKLNAAAEMLPLSSPRWNNIHPFVPVNQTQGYQFILKKLEEQLNEITGFAGTSLQPNSGAQGEYAGLMVIRAYHQSRNEGFRNICLIPASAHGTNPASAVMAGMKVVVVSTDKHGNIDLEDLQVKAKENGEHLAALMVTYPSTHGVFESSIQTITETIHQFGGQVYMDGANMNAQVGLTNPAIIGADVCHLNLHKTFAIPHGGGGPGVGPICVASHLVDFLPSNPIIQTGGKQSITAISSAPWGSAMICLISYGYIKMLGGKGLQMATELAILNANYIKSRLEEHYAVLYQGEKGKAAHELIIDCRAFKEKGIEVVDIAKRLMDYGFHAPTVSFPVNGTMMIEPTESENLEEIDAFCDAMIAIRYEINAIDDTEEENNVLRNAPHTLQMLTSDEWNLPYSRTKAAYPLPFIRKNKFWPSVRRVDEAFGDRNLVCSCEPIEAYISN